MRLGDLFIGSRQLFGFLAPGALWLVSLAIPWQGEHLIALWMSARAVDVVLFLAAALVFGTAVETLSFQFAVRLSARICRSSVSRETHDFDFLPGDVPPELMNRARTAAVEGEPSLGYIKSMTNREFSQFCKNSVLEHSQSFARRLTEYEAEINLLAMLVLPLLLLAAVVGIFGLTGEDVTPGTQRIAVRIALPLFSVGVALALLLRLHPLRREEAEWWFRFFLMLAPRGGTGSRTATKEKCEARASPIAGPATPPGEPRVTEGRHR